MYIHVQTSWRPHIDNTINRFKSVAINLFIIEESADELPQFVYPSVTTLTSESSPSAVCNLSDSEDTLPVPPPSPCTPVLNELAKALENCSPSSNQSPENDDETETEFQPIESSHTALYNTTCRGSAQNIEANISDGPSDKHTDDQVHPSHFIPNSATLEGLEHLYDKSDVVIGEAATEVCDHKPADSENVIEKSPEEDGYMDEDANVTEVPEPYIADDNLVDGCKVNEKSGEELAPFPKANSPQASCVIDEDKDVPSFYVDSDEAADEVENVELSSGSYNAEQSDDESEDEQEMADSEIELRHDDDKGESHIPSVSILIYDSH